MFSGERRKVIVELVRANGAASLRELARAVDASEVTVRRDLRLLEDEGLLRRHHGGAVASVGVTHEPTYSEKAHVAASEKADIADLAIELVHDGDAIVIGAGTTTQAFSRRLVRLTDVTVVTNSLLVAQTLARARGIEVVMTGGTLRGSIFATVGGITESVVAGLHVSRAFLSGNGLTAARGLSTPNIQVAGVDRAMAQAAGEIVVLADHTKLGLDTMVQTVPMNRIDHVVTDAGAPEDQVEALRAAGATVHVAHPRRATAIAL